MGSTVKAPPPRNYLTEMQDALRAQAGIQGQLLDLERQWTPEYQKLQELGISGGLTSLGNLYGQAQGISSGIQRQFLGAQAPLYGEVGKASLEAYQQSLDPQTRGLYASMMQSAQTDLNAGRNLTPEMERLAQQSARQAMAARGLSGNQAIGQEVLNTYQMGQMREDRARQFGAGMYSAGLAQTQMANAMYGQPLMQQMTAFNPSSLIQGAGAMYGSLGPQLFQPESQYNAQLISANRQEEMQARMATAQNKAALVGGLMKMGGAVLGGMATGGTGFFAAAAKPDIGIGG